MVVNSLSSLFSQIDVQTMFIVVSFIISFAIINFALLKFFRGDKTTSGIVAFAISLLIVYGINKQDYNLNSMASNLDISIGANIYSLFLIILALAIAYTIYKFKKTSPFIIGGIFILLSFFVYEQIVVFLIGLVTIIIGFLINQKSWDKIKNK